MERVKSFLSSDKTIKILLILIAVILLLGILFRGLPDDKKIEEYWYYNNQYIPQNIE